VLLLVDRRMEPAARFHLSTGGEDDSDEGHTQDSSLVSGDSTYMPNFDSLVSLTG
jgi:hypothetical protein